MMKPASLPRLLLVIGALCCAACSQQRGYVLDVALSGFADSTRFAVSDRDMTLCDTIVLVGGKMRYELLLPDEFPRSLRLFGPVPVSGGDYYAIPFFAGNGAHERISGAVEDIAALGLRFEGAPWSEDIMAYNRSLGPVERERNELAKRYRSLTPQERDRYRALNARIDSLREAFICADPNSHVALDQLTWMMERMPRERIRAVYERLEPEFRRTPDAKSVETFLRWEKIAPGAALLDYDIAGEDAAGRRVRLSEVDGDYLVVVFTSNGCGYCMLAAREMAALHDPWAGRVTMVAYSCDAAREQWREEVERNGAEWLSIWNGEGPRGETCIKYGVNGYPCYFIFGPERTLLESWFGYQEGLLEARLASLVK